MKNLQIKKLILGNGLTFLYCHTPHMVSFDIAMYINSGSRDEEEKNNGVSHFLEHMMFRGSAKYPNSVLLARALEQFGGEINAVTSAEQTHYWIKGHAEKTLEAVECFAEFFLNPVFADLELERRVILQELASDVNEESLSIDTESLAMGALFGDHPLGFPIIGSECNIRELSQRHLQEFREKMYVPHRCVLTIHTSLEECKVLESVRKAFDFPWNRKTFCYERLSALSVFPKKEGLHKPQNSLRLQNNPDNQFAFKLALPLRGGLNAEATGVTFFQRFLDDGICTRLPARIREQYGLVYDISCDSQFFEDVGVFTLEALVSEDLLGELLHKLSLEINDFLTIPPSQAEIDHIRFRYLFDLRQIQESPSRLFAREVSQIFFQSTFSLENEYTLVESLTADDIFQTGQHLFYGTRRGFALVGPKARKKRDLIEKFLSWTTF